MRDFVERRYTDAEFRRILDEATRSELQAERVVATGAGHTLAEIRDIAQEVGIDPAEVDRAAANMVASESIATTASPQTAFSRVLHEELTIPRALSNAEMQLVAVQAERVLGRRGAMRSSGDWVEWRDGRDRLYVGVVRGTDRTRVRVIADQSRDLLTGGGIIAALALMLMPTALSAGPAGTSAALLLLGGGACALFAGYAKWTSTAMRNHMRELLEILQDAVRP